MAKTYKKRRYYRRKGRWSANIKTLTNKGFEVPAGDSFFIVENLCENPPQVDTTVSQQYTVKNIELTYEMEASGNDALEGITAYIIYVPQGMTVTETYPNQHPEYIMAYRFLGSPDLSSTSGSEVIGRNPVRVKTRMARRLQTGDKIILLITGTSSAGINLNLNFNGLVRWWTKAN